MQSSETPAPLYSVFPQASDRAYIARRHDSIESQKIGHEHNAAPRKTAHKRFGSLEADQEHQLPVADAGRENCPPADVNLRLYVARPQNTPTKEKNYQQGQIVNINEAGLSFETANSPP